ncbi:MAG: type II secretion system GspH family protein [Planctomycetes bacterium]|nr:type II secretion system GspH family protein [Planctomycetota bacterium]
MAAVVRPATGSRPAFTLIEAMVALSLTALAGAAILLTIETSLNAADQALEQTVAVGMAEQLLDEVAGAMYIQPGGDPRAFPLGPSAWEAQGAGRSRYNDNGDYDGFAAQPPQDRWGQPLGSEDDDGGLRPPGFRAPSGSLNGWRRSVEVYYLDPDDLSARLAAGQTSDYRAVEVVISRETADGQFREIARRRRTLAYLPSAP